MGFFRGYGGGCGFGGGYGYSGGYSGSNFAIIVVLFVLLVIVGGSCFKG
ncbi:YjcZ family sporulation protein [Priestia megaterium]|nr:YjcZ family sporulation protein [Priestia megaterium]MDY0943983.1 YjcZ family sporulation protein [Priestia megaterium]